MRKMRDSSNTACRRSVSSRAEASEWPKGFSTTMRLRLVAQPAAPMPSAIVAKYSGGVAR